MKKYKAVLILTTVVLLLSFLLVGCGVSQEEYDRVNVELRASQARVAELQSEIRGLKEQYEIVAAQLRTSWAQIAEVQKEYNRVSAQLRASELQVAELETKIKGLREQYELVGGTPAETAENIVRRYHETHLYSKSDFFACADMSLDVWNMLKTQGINALIQIGNVDMEAKDLTEVNHAWVLAEVSPGQYLALETTGGYIVKDNSLYYKGWSFDNPREYKRFVELKYEYNLRIDMVNKLVNKLKELSEDYEKEKKYYQELVNEFNRRYVGRPVSLEAFNFKDKMEAQLAVVKKMEGRYTQLIELIKEQTQKLENIISEMRGLTD